MDEHPKPEKAAGGETQSVSEQVDVSVWDVDNAKLAELGYKSEFRREFSLLETCAFRYESLHFLDSPRWKQVF